ncbi:MAG: acetate--CoA ligase family protein [SAR324 cluster bacterium]|nr:acetate--CoA ligase family protein [SAR324 cluster bacterium]
MKYKSLQAIDARVHKERDIKSLFEPSSVAVIGASPDPDGVGHSILRNLMMGGFKGTIFPVNPKHKNILSMKCYASVLDIEDSLDMAVVVISGKLILQLLEELHQKGVSSAIIISAGFKEAGQEGVELEKQVHELAREYGISLLGPNCLGLINTDSKVSMNASFSRGMALPGNIALMSQSGALCTSILDYAKGNQIGFSKFISFGNKVDLNENDLLRYLAYDPKTQVILMYLEDLTDGMTFMHLAREVTSKYGAGKPILAIKTGRTNEGASAAASHTGSLAGSDEVYDAIMAQAGVLRVDTVQELFDYAMAFGNQPLPQSNRVAILTNAGGPGIMTTDACIRYGLQLSKFESTTIEMLKSSLPPTANVNNPVDVIGDARHDRYEAALQALLNDDNTDAVIVILTPQTMTDIEEIAQVVSRLAKDTEKPILASFMGWVDVSPGVKILRENGIPHYLFPENAAKVLATMATYKKWTKRAQTKERIFEVDRGKAHQVIQDTVNSERTLIPEWKALQILDAYGFPVLPSRLAKTKENLPSLCAQLGFPLVMKIVSPDIIHKTEANGVAVGVADLESALQTFEQLMNSARQYRPDAEIWGVMLQQMAKKGKEIILGATRYPKFGPIVMFGLGGIYTEVLKDVTFRLAPMRSENAQEMMSEIKGKKILNGVRGEAPADLEAIQECIERLSQLVVEFPVIQELDINPLIVSEYGASVADARIVLAEYDDLKELEKN